MDSTADAVVVSIDGSATGAEALLAGAVFARDARLRGAALATVFLAADFFAVVFLADAFLAAVLLAGFFTAVFFVADFFAAVLLAGDFRVRVAFFAGVAASAAALSAAVDDVLLRERVVLRAVLAAVFLAALRAGRRLGAGFVSEAVGAESSPERLLATSSVGRMVISSNGPLAGNERLGRCMDESTTEKSSSPHIRVRP